jgi:hypothetical protein
MHLRLQLPDDSGMDSNPGKSFAFCETTVPVSGNDRPSSVVELYISNRAQCDWLPRTQSVGSLALCFGTAGECWSLQSCKRDAGRGNVTRWPLVTLTAPTTLPA